MILQHEPSAKSGPPSPRSPRVSVVIPAYNAVPFIRETVDSVRAQSLKDIEVIVVDDGSTDGTVDTITDSEHGRLRILRQANQGVSTARNTGLREAKGEYILFLDADDVLLPEALARLVDILRAAPDAVASYGPSLSMTADGQRMAPTRRLSKFHWPDGDVLERLISGNFITCPGSLLIRRTALQQAGNFRTDLRSEDWELWCRLALLGRFVFAGLDPIMLHRVHVSSRSRTGKKPTDDASAIAAVFEHPDICARVSPSRLRRLRRRREAQAYLLCGLEATRRRRWADARRYMIGTLRRRLISPWAIAIAPFTLIGWLPPSIVKRIVAD